MSGLKSKRDQGKHGERNMPDSSERRFDLNIEKILEGWETCHAVREIIANALDEQVLTGTRDVDISKDRKGVWHIRDFGRGLKYEHLTQNENQEKLKNPAKVIGKFGVGLKDALATLSRRKVDALIRSKYGDISLEQTPKHGFPDVARYMRLSKTPPTRGSLAQMSASVALRTQTFPPQKTSSSSSQIKRYWTKPVTGRF